MWYLLKLRILGYPTSGLVVVTVQQCHFYTIHEKKGQELNGGKGDEFGVTKKS